MEQNCNMDRTCFFDACMNEIAMRPRCYHDVHSDVECNNLCKAAYINTFQTIFKKTQQRHLHPIYRIQGQKHAINVEHGIRVGAAMNLFHS